MNTQLISPLIRKDWNLHRTEALVSLTAGIAALGVLQVRTEITFVLGSVWFFVALIVLGCWLPISAVINERKKQTLAFIMSLPVSAVEYTVAKITSAVILFVVPWTALLIGALMLIKVQHIFPNGIIPTVWILALLPLIGFFVICGAALVSESEGLSIAATILCNSSYGIVWYLLARMPEIHNNWSSPVAVWSGIAQRVLFGEIALIVLIVAVTLFLQSRKRDFV
jgi:ABC-type transport system involved in multi-copper enzyme maturation permease subunit